jgi:hypothetical protein
LVNSAFEPEVLRQAVSKSPSIISEYYAGSYSGKMFVPSNTEEPDVGTLSPFVMFPRCVLHHISLAMAAKYR